MIKLNALGDRVIIQRDDDIKEHASGILLVEEKKQLSGVVVSKGPGCVNLKEGDKVLFTKMSGRKFNFHGIDYINVEERNVFATANE